MNNSKILVTYGNVYDIDQEDGSKIRGTSLQYFFLGEELTEFNSKQTEFGKPAGKQRAKASVDYNVFNDKISYVPAIYDAQLEMNIGADGRPVIKVTDVEFFSKVELKLTK